MTTRLPEEYRFEPETALRLLREEILARFLVHDLQAELRKEFLVSAAREGTAGGRIYDAYIAEIARQAGARLVATENRRQFTPLLRHGIRVLVSAEPGAVPVGPDARPARERPPPDPRAS